MPKPDDVRIDKAPPTTLVAEIAALTEVLKTFDSIDSDARYRVYVYVAKRFNLPLPPSEY